MRIHEVTLHIDDGFLLAELRGRELRIERRFLRDGEEPAATSGGRMRRIECEQCRSRAAGGDQEFAARPRELASEPAGPFARERIRALARGIERNRREFPVRRRVELDRQSLTFGIAIRAAVGGGHGRTPLAKRELTGPARVPLLSSGLQQVRRAHCKRRSRLFAGFAAMSVAPTKAIANPQLTDCTIGSRNGASTA